MGAVDVDGASDTIAVPGEIRINIPAFPWGTLVLRLEKSTDYPNREFLVTPRWEPTKLQVLTVSKTEGSVKQGLLVKLDWILRQPQLPYDFHLADFQQMVSLAIQALEE